MSDKHQKPKSRNNAAGFTKAGRNSRTGGKNQHASRRSASAQGTYANGKTLFGGIGADRFQERLKAQADHALELLNPKGLGSEGHKIAEALIIRYGKTEGRMTHEVRLQQAIDLTLIELDANLTDDYVKKAISRAKGSLAAAYHEQLAKTVDKTPSRAARQMAAMAGAR